MRRKDCWKAFRDLTKAVRGEVDLKVEVLDVLWNARLVDCVALGSCLIHVVMAIGRRRTNAMLYQFGVCWDLKGDMEGRFGKKRRV